MFELIKKMRHGSFAVVFSSVLFILATCVAAQSPKRLIPEGAFDTIAQAGIDEKWVQAGTGNRNLDETISEWLNDICSEHKLSVNFLILNSGGDLDNNAFAITNWDEYKDEFTDGTIILGLRLLKENKGLPFLQYAVLAHETWHLIQHKQQSKLAGPERELDADRGAGMLLVTFLAPRFKNINVYVWNVCELFFNKGETAYNSPSSHGTAQERLMAFTSGVDHELKKRSKIISTTIRSPEKTWYGTDPELKHPHGTAAGKSWVVTAADGSGFLSFGPYVELLEGRYQAEFTFNYIKDADPQNTDALLELDVSTWNKSVPISEFRVQKYVFEWDVPPDNARQSQKPDYILEFEVSKSTVPLQWEFRVFTWARVNFALEKITLKKL